MANTKSKSSSKKIMIVDDEEGVRESLKLVLGDHYDLLVCETGGAALELLQTAHPEVGVIMMDIKMPKKSGLETLEELHKKYPKIKVIIVTGYKSVETAQEAVRLGASGYIVKPFKGDEILATVGKNIR